MPSSIPSPRSAGETRTTAVPLHWCAYGPAGGERLLVLHGGPGAQHDYLLPQMLHLAGRRELVFYDQRGGGKSRSDDSLDVTWRSHVDDLALVARELALEPLSIVGYSWGALLALLYALEATRHQGWPHPKRLVLIDPAPLSRPLRQRFEDEFARRQRSEALREMREDLAESGLRERDPEAFRRRQFELGVAAYFARPESARDLTQFRVTGRVQDAVWASLGDFDVVSQLESLHIPAFFVHGRHDPIPLESTERASRAMHARLLVLEASGHVPYVEQPAALFGAIEQFLDDTAGSLG